MGNQVLVTSNASGAVTGGQLGHVVVIVDVISMSTTLEAALDAGALAVYGASPDICRAPVQLDPYKIGLIAGQRALADGSGEVVIVSEPRIGTDAERLARAQKTISGVKAAGAKVGAVLPNLGAETAKLIDFTNQVVVAVTDTGGVAYDAAWQAGAASVVVGTVARTLQQRGLEPARTAAARACAEAQRCNTGITVVAASANSLEDILAAEFIAKEIIGQGFTQLKG